MLRQSASPPSSSYQMSEMNGFFFLSSMSIVVILSRQLIETRTEAHVNKVFFRIRQTCVILSPHFEVVYVKAG